MSRARVAVVGLLSAALAGASPVGAAGAAGATGAQPVPTPGPGVCDERLIMLEEDEVLEERTLYFRGNAPVGNVDGHNEASLSGPPNLALSPQAPSASEDKVYAARPTGVIGNPNSNRNPFQGYWWRTQPAAERIVCAGATVFAATDTGQLTIQLWVDQPRATSGSVTRSVTGSAAANQVSEFTVNFGPLDVTAVDNLVVQLDPAIPGALAFYDSTGRPSQLNYVVVVPAP